MGWILLGSVRGAPGEFHICVILASDRAWPSITAWSLGSSFTCSPPPQTTPGYPSILSISDPHCCPVPRYFCLPRKAWEENPTEHQTSLLTQKGVVVTTLGQLEGLEKSYLMTVQVPLCPVLFKWALFSSFFTLMGTSSLSLRLKQSEWKGMLRRD